MSSEVIAQKKDQETYLMTLVGNIYNLTSLDVMFRANLISYWTLTMILTDMFHIHVAITMLSDLNVELESHQKSLGFAAFLAWNGLASYLVHYKDYAYIPNTIFKSGVAVLYGIIGVFPVAMGLAVLTSVYMS